MDSNNYQKDLLKIKGIVYRYIDGDKIDKEQLSIDIWTELWEKDRPVTYIAVKRRCIDKIRTLTRRGEKYIDEVFKEPANIISISSTSRESTQVSDQLNYLLEHTELNFQEKAMIQLMYGLGKRAIDIALQMKVSQTTVQTHIKAAIGKIKETHQLVERTIV